ncbi:MAG: kynureninase [Acidimicrobiales bacterium]
MSTSAGVPRATDGAVAGDRAVTMDGDDPLGEFVACFERVDGVNYLAGHSLGPLGTATASALGSVVRDQWATLGVQAWHDWADWPMVVGDLLGRAVLGAGPGQVVVADSTSVNLYKLASAALEGRPDRKAVVGWEGDFSTDRYVLEGLAYQRGLDLRWVTTSAAGGPDPSHLAECIDPSVALVVLSHVDFRTSAVADMAGITAWAHAAGALVLWDLSHSVGAVALDLDSCDVDLAVGCTYKHLAGGPGAPALAYVRRDLQEHLRQPVWGWFGQSQQFYMGLGYQPKAGIAAFLSGTPSVLGLAGVKGAAELVAEAGLDRAVAKARGLCAYAIELADLLLGGFGVEVASPRQSDRRGAHLALRCPQSEWLCQALAERAGVVVDQRPPDLIRMGLSPLSTTYVQVHQAIVAMADLLADSLAS